MKLAREIDLSEFLMLQKFLKFDYLFAGKDKKPIKGVFDFLNPEIMIRDLEIIKNHHSPELVGIILKRNLGLPISDKKLLVLDVDCKKNQVRGKEVFDDIVDYLTNLGHKKETILSLSEKTLSGGYHVFLTSDSIHPQKKIIIEEGIEIEIFTNNKYIAVAPSLGYETLSGDSCVNFNEASQITLNSFDLDNFVGHFEITEEKITQNVENNDELNEKFIADETNWNKITKGWLELDRFVQGETNSDWDKITNEGSAYNYVRFNIMPVFIIFGKSEEFLKIIAGYTGKHTSKWKDYPDRWLESKEQGILVIGKDARRRLWKIGFFEKERTRTRQNLIDDFLTTHMKILFKHVISVYDAIYYYNDEYKCYTYLEYDTFQNFVINYYRDSADVNISVMEVRTLYENFYAHAKAISLKEDKHPTYNQYQLLEDRSYERAIAICFRNGTLYIWENSVEFKQGYHSADDKCLYTIQTDYTPAMFTLEDSTVIDWFRTKFKDPKALSFIQMYFGQLLIPNYSPDCMLVLFSYKGALGKSTLAKTLSSIFYIGNNSMISTYPLTKVGDRFGGSVLSRSLFNITTELDDRIDSTGFKEVISREKRAVENKHENIKFEIPLAKHISMGNSVPVISPDGGVVRRLAVFELSEERAMADVESKVFNKLFTSDKVGFLSFMIQGLMKLKKLGFIDLSNFYRETFKENIDQLREYNSNVYEFLAMQGYDEILKATNCSMQGLSIEDIFKSYRKWCEEMGYNGVTKRTVAKYISASSKFVRKQTRIGDTRMWKIIVSGEE